jgi:hypothetical protein
MKTTMDNIKSRYGDKRIFYYENTNWYVDLVKCLTIKFVGEENAIVAIDPDGGPHIAIGDKLSDYHAVLPDVKITRLERISQNVYKLT